MDMYNPKNALLVKLHAANFLPALCRDIRNRLADVLTQSCGAAHTDDDSSCGLVVAGAALVPGERRRSAIDDAL